jgi:transposase
MATLAQKPATTPIPVQLSGTEFQQFIFPHLSMPKRGPKCKLGYHRVFNLILWVLYTGMQWKCLPVGSVAKFDFWAKSKNWVSVIQWLRDAQTLEKATLRQNPWASLAYPATLD